ncbi:hypothetical protein IDG51_03215 [Pelagibacterales bacterium SAG-MED14]|nr:hypothetical protein [Pelagibacterales bacterium SAG-MED14]
MSKKKNSLILVGLLLLGFLLRYFNTISDGYWFDETLSFFISDPNISFQDFVLRHKTIIGGAEHNPILYFLILREYLNLIGYSSENARLFTILIGSSSILIAFFYFSYLNNKKKIFYIISFLIFNIFLIWQSKEVRPASIILFFSLINNLYFLFYINNLSKFNTLVLIILNCILLSLYPFTIVVLIAQLITCLYFVNKNKLRFIFIFVFSITFYFFFNYEYILMKLTSVSSHWGTLDIKFFFNYFYRTFFGSIFLGGISLILTFFAFIEIFRKKKYKNFFIFFNFTLIIVSYLFVVVYSILISGIAVPRYFIFIIPSIILIITDFLFDKKKIYLNLYLILTIFNTLIIYDNFKIKKPPVYELVKTLDARSKNLYLTDDKWLFNHFITNNNYISSKYKFIKNIDSVPNFWHVCLNNPRYAVGNNINLPDEKSCQIIINNYKLIEVIRLDDFKLSLFQKNDIN